MRRCYLLLLLVFVGCGPVQYVARWHNSTQPAIVRTVKIVKSNQGSDTVLVEEIQYYKNGQEAFRIHYSDGVRHGKYESYWPSGTPKVIGRYSLGRKDKKWIFQSERGWPDSIRTYSNGELNGPSFDFWPGGIKKAERNYRNNVLHGKMQLYDQNETLRLAARFQDGYKSGKWVWQDEAGQIDSMKTYVRNALNGVAAYYNDNGILIEKKHYKDDVLDGKVEAWYDDGTRRLSGEYRANISDGTWKWWDEQGNLIRLITYDGGVKQGKFEIYNQGKLVQKGEYEDDMRHGTWVWKKRKGQVDSTITYSHGLKTGKYIRYHVNGEKAVTGAYTSGERDKKWVWQNSSGQVDSMKSYATGILNGEVIYFHNNGETSLIIPYWNGRKNGIVRSFFSDGTKESEWSWQAGNREGEYRIWSRSGNVVEAGTYHDDKPYGQIDRYFRSGGLSTTATYAQGVPHGVLRVFNPSGVIVKEQYYIFGEKICEFEYHPNGLRRRVSILISDSTVFSQTWDKYGQVESVTEIPGLRSHVEYFPSGVVQSERLTSDQEPVGVAWYFYEDRSLKKVIAYAAGKMILKRVWERGSNHSTDELFRDGVRVCRVSEDRYEPFLSSGYDMTNKSGESKQE